jgi:hypothetical protein
MTANERPWRVRYYYSGTVHVTHPMSRLSALALAATFRHQGASACAVPLIERRRVRSLPAL